jgi:hypothetical protein
MIVQLYYVEVPDSTTRRLTVPKYDIPIIKAAWRGQLAPGSSLRVRAMGIIEARSLYNEARRLRRDYATVPQGEEKPAWKVIYATDEALAAVYDDAVKEAEGLQEQFEKQRQLAAAAAVVEDVQPGAIPELRARVEAELRKEIGDQVRAEIEQDLVGSHMEELKKEIRAQLLAEMNAKPKRVRGENVESARPRGRPATAKAKA